MDKFWVEGSQDSVPPPLFKTTSLNLPHVLVQLIIELPDSCKVSTPSTPSQRYAILLGLYTIFKQEHHMWTSKLKVLFAFEETVII